MFFLIRYYNSTFVKISLSLERDAAKESALANCLYTEGVRATFMHKGQPAKGFDAITKSFKYVRIFGYIGMFGAEGAECNRSDRTTTHSTSQTDFGLTAVGVALATMKERQVARPYGV